MMPNGNILCAVSPAKLPGVPTSPISYYEYDYTNNSFTQVNAPEGGYTTWALLTSQEEV